MIDCDHQKLKAFFKICTFCNFSLINLYKLVTFLETTQLLIGKTDIWPKQFGYPLYFFSYSNVTSHGESLDSKKQLK